MWDPLPCGHFGMEHHASANVPVAKLFGEILFWNSEPCKKAMLVLDSFLLLERKQNILKLKKKNQVHLEGKNRQPLRRFK